MPTLAEIRDGLARTIQTGTGLRTGAYPPGQIDPPANAVGARSGNWEDTDGGGQVTIPLWTVVQPTSPEAFDVIDAAIEGPRSVSAALAADPALGLGTGVDAAVTEWTEGEVEIGGTTYWGVRHDISVMYAGGED